MGAWDVLEDEAVWSQVTLVQHDKHLLSAVLPVSAHPTQPRYVSKAAARTQDTERDGVDAKAWKWVA